jgi:DNA-binding CsgD family transcriptional regulator/pimeloyl-ACP methyl ester carboxylesterase
LNWSIPSAGSWHEALAARFRLIHFDNRGRGMSTRGLRQDFEVTDFDIDLAAVMDRAGKTPVVLVALGSSSHSVVRYAVKHPDRVLAVVMLNGYISSQSARGAPWSLTADLGRTNWEMFLETLSPGTRWSAEQRQQSIHHFGQMMTQADWLRATEALSSSDISALLPALITPTLVIQVRDFKRVDPVESTRLAALIPNASLTAIDGDDAYGDAEQGMRAIESFLATLPSAAVAEPEPGGRQIVANLSSREIEVLRLVSAGKSNQEIAAELVISINTVRRHVSNIFDKTGAANRAQAVAYARDHDLH